MRSSRQGLLLALRDAIRSVEGVKAGISALGDAAAAGMGRGVCSAPSSSRSPLSALGRAARSASASSSSSVGTGQFHSFSSLSSIEGFRGLAFLRGLRERLSQIQARPHPLVGGLPPNPRLAVGPGRPSLG